MTDLKKQELKVVSQQQIAEKTFKLVAHGSEIDESIRPGQFAHLRVTKQLDPLLRRPISVCDVDVPSRCITFVYRVVGRGTALLAELKPGDLLDVLLPLGSGFPLNAAEPGETALLVGGGIGVPPLYYLAKELAARKVKVVSMLGFRTRQDAFFVEDFGPFGVVRVVTEDGSLGTAGVVTDVLAEELEGGQVVYACGPTPMLKAVQDCCHDTPAYLSLEERLGCGIGACYGCTCRVKGETGLEYRKTCSDGPVFRAGEVIL